MIKELVKDIAKYLPSYIIPGLVSIFAIPIITHLFSPEEYGNYVLVITTIYVLSALATAWLGASITRFLSAYKLKNSLEEFYSIVVKLSFLSIIIISFIFLSTLFFAQNNISCHLCVLLKVGFWVFIVSSISNVLINIFRAKRQVVQYSFFMVWRSMAGLGFGIALVMVFHYGVEGLLWGSFLCITLALPLLWRGAIGNPVFKKGRICSSMSSEIVKYGVPVMIVNLATWILSLSDRYILGFFRGSWEVGVYSASYAISERSIFLVASLFLVASPPIAFNIWERQGIDRSREFVRNITRYYLLVGFPIAVGLSILARPVLEVLVPPAYYQGWKIIPIVVFGAFLVGIEHRFAIGLNYHKRTDLLMYCVLGSSLVNIGLNFLFIPRYGYMAAALTTFASYAFLLLVVVFISRRYFVWRFPLRSLGRIALASAMMSVVIYLIGGGWISTSLVSLLLAVLVGIVVYIFSIFLLGEIKSTEKKFIKRTLRKYLLSRFREKE